MRTRTLNESEIAARRWAYESLYVLLLDDLLKTVQAEIDHIEYRRRTEAAAITWMRERNPGDPRSDDQLLGACIAEVMDKLPPQNRPEAAMRESAYLRHLTDEVMKKYAALIPVRAELMS